MADISNLSNYLKDLADAIREKKGTEGEIPAANFDTEILSIESGIDTSDANAQPNDILRGKVAYNNTGKIVGTIETNKIASSDFENAIQFAKNSNINNAYICDIDYEHNLYLYSNSNDIQIRKINNNTLTDEVLASSKSNQEHIDAKFVNSSVDNIIYFISISKYSGDIIDITLFQYNTDTKNLVSISSQSSSLYSQYSRNHIILLKSSKDEFCILSPNRLFTFYVKDSNLSSIRGYPNEIETFNKTWRNWLMRGAKFLDNGFIQLTNTVVKYDKNSNALTDVSDDYPGIRFMFNDGTWIKFSSNDNKAYLMSGTNIISDISSYFTGIDTFDTNYNGIYNVDDCVAFVIKPTDIYGYGLLTMLRKKPDNTFETLQLQIDDVYLVVNSNDTSVITGSYCDKIIPTEEYISAINLDGNTYNKEKTTGTNSSEILFNKQAYVDGVLLTGSMPNNGELDYTASKDIDIEIPEGYISGGLIHKVTSDVDENIIPENIIYGKNILGVTGEIDITEILYNRIQEIKNDTVLVTGTQRSNTINTNIGNYVYSVVWYRYNKTVELPNISVEGWTLLCNIKGQEVSSLDYTQNVMVYYKLATSETETFDIIIENAISLSIFMISAVDAKVPSQLISSYTEPDSDTFNIGFIQKGDIIICSSIYYNSGDVSRELFEPSFAVSEVIGESPTSVNAGSRETVMIPKETVFDGSIVNWSNSNGCLILVLRTQSMDGQNLLPENIKKDIPIFGVVGTLDVDSDYSGTISPEEYNTALDTTNQILGLEV